FIHRIGMKRLHAAEDAGKRLERDADHVVDRLLGGKGCARGLGVRPKHHRARVPAPKRSFMIRAHIRRAARSLATSSRKSLWIFQKNESRGAKSSTESPRRTASST